MAATKEVPLTYAIGDVVRVKETGEEGPITDVSSEGMDYGCCGMAWRNFDKLEFIHRATKESLQIVKDEYEEEFGSED